jgi:hypothetical protein
MAKQDAMEAFKTQKSNAKGKKKIVSPNSPTAGDFSCWTKRFVDITP